MTLMNVQAPMLLRMHPQNLPCAALERAQQSSCCLMGISIMPTCISLQTRLVMPQSNVLSLLCKMTGVDEGFEVEFRGMGLPSQMKGGPAGDLVVEIQVDEHPDFVRDGLDIHHKLKVDFVDAILGSRLR